MSDIITSAKEHIQSEEIKHDPEMDKSAVWAGSGCMAVFPISGSRLISPPGIPQPKYSVILTSMNQAQWLIHDGSGLHNLGTAN